jgi:hypothetical protein
MAGMDVTAKLGLDTANFEAGAERAARAAKKSAEAQALAAKFATDAVTDQSKRELQAIGAAYNAKVEYRRVQSLTRQGYLDEQQGAQATSAAYQRLTAATAERTAALELQTRAIATHGAVSDRMAASAVVRGLESGNVGIRAVENTLTSFAPAGVLQAAFSVLGPLAFAAAIGKGAEAFYQMAEKATNAGETVRRAFQSMNDKAVVGIDDIELLNSKLQDQIDKISGHPDNGLATALIEDKKRADELLISLQSDRKEYEALLKANSINPFESFISGVAGTGRQEREILGSLSKPGGDLQKIQDAVRGARDTFETSTAGSRDKKAVEAAGKVRDASIRAAFQQTIDVYRGEASRLKQEQARSEADAAAAASSGEGSVGLNGINNAAKIANVEGIAQALASRQQMELLSGQTRSLQEKLGEVKQHRGDGEATRKAAEAQMKSFESGMAQMKNMQVVSVSDEIRYWESKAGAAAKYPDNLLKVTEKTGQLYQEMTRQTEAWHRKQEEVAARSAAIDKREYAELEAFATKLDEADARRADGVIRLAEANSKNADLMAQQSAAHDLATGAIDKYSYALQTAALHASEYRAQLAALDAENRSLTEEDIANGRGANYDAKRAAISGAADRTAQADAYNANSQTGLGGATSALEEFMAETRDVAKQMRDIVGGTLTKVNSSLLEELTTRSRNGPRHLGTTLAHGLAVDATGALLKKGEGSLLAMLPGLKGKHAPTGASGDPLHVIMGASGASGIGGGKGAAGAIGLLASLSKGFIPGFAGGVNDFAGGLAMVGERGPELVNMPRGSSVTPNNRLSGMGGATVHVDARGSSNPAETEAAVHRAMTEYLPHVVAASVRAVGERRDRMPSSRS